MAFPVPTYSLYDTLIEIQDGRAIAVDYPADFSLPEALAEQNAALTFLCNPNSPSGTLVSLAEIESLARAVSGILVVDEAYVDFAESEGASSIPVDSPASQSGRATNFFQSRFPSPACASGWLSRPKKLFRRHDESEGFLQSESLEHDRGHRGVAGYAVDDAQRRGGSSGAARSSLPALRRWAIDVYPSHANFVLARKSGTKSERGLREA